MHVKHLLTASVLTLSAASPAFAENVLRWTSQGDALTLDPHSQNEAPDNCHERPDLRDAGDPRC